jgi:hypothetical protein
VWLCSGSKLPLESKRVVRGDRPDSSSELRCGSGVGAVEECCDSVREAVELPRCFRLGEGSPCCGISLPLPQPVVVLPAGVALLLLLPCRSLAGSSLGRLEPSSRHQVSFDAFFEQWR